MIDISVSNLVKEFEVGNKILDGLTFQVDTGERVGIAGPQRLRQDHPVARSSPGCMDYDEGEVIDRPGQAPGPHLPDPRLPGGLHRGGRARHRLCPAATAWKRRWPSWPSAWRRERATPLFWPGTTSSPPPSRPEGAMRPTPTKIRSATACLSPQAMREQPFDQLSGRREDQGEPGPAHSGGHGHPPAGRAHQPPGPAGHRVAGGIPGKVQGHGAGRLPRPLLPGQGGGPGH